MSKLAYMFDEGQTTVCVLCARNEKSDEKSRPASPKARVGVLISKYELENCCDFNGVVFIRPEKSQFCWEANSWCSEASSLVVTISPHFPSDDYK